MRWMWRWNLQENDLLRAIEALRLIQRHLEQPGVLVDGRPRFVATARDLIIAKSMLPGANGVMR